MPERRNCERNEEWVCVKLVKMPSLRIPLFSIAHDDGSSSVIIQRPSEIEHVRVEAPSHAASPSSTRGEESGISGKDLVSKWCAGEVTFGVDSTSNGGSLGSMGDKKL